MIVRLGLLGAAAIAAGFALSGCRTLDEQQCNVTDWRLLGEADGVAGRQQSYVARHQEACNTYGILVDVPTWQSGWEVGIRRHCTPENGLDIGLKGRGSSSACPADLAFDYSQAYRIGSDLYSARKAVEKARDQLDDANDSLAAAGPDNHVARRREVEVKRKELAAAENRLDAAQRAVDLLKSRLLARR